MRTGFGIDTEAIHSVMEVGDAERSRDNGANQGLRSEHLVEIATAAVALEGGVEAKGARGRDYDECE